MNRFDREQLLSSWQWFFGWLIGTHLLIIFCLLVKEQWLPNTNKIMMSMFWFSFICLSIVITNPSKHIYDHNHRIFLYSLCAMLMAFTAGWLIDVVPNVGSQVTIKTTKDLKLVKSSTFQTFPKTIQVRPQLCGQSYGIYITNRHEARTYNTYCVCAPKLEGHDHSKPYPFLLACKAQGSDNKSCGCKPSPDQSKTFTHTRVVPFYAQNAFKEAKDYLASGHYHEKGFNSFKRDLEKASEKRILAKMSEVQRIGYKLMRAEASKISPPSPTFKTPPKIDSNTKLLIQNNVSSMDRDEIYLKGFMGLTFPYLIFLLGFFYLREKPLKRAERYY